MPSGKPEEECGAFVKARNKACGLPKGWGTPHPGSGHCKWHFGNTATGKMAAAKEAGLKILKYTEPIDIDPTTALLQEVYRTAGHVAYLDQQIAKWELDVGEEIPDAQRQWMTVHIIERKHLASVAKLALDAGVQEREVRVAEQQGMILADAIQQILELMQLSPEQKLLVPSVVPPVLRAISIREDRDVG